MSSTVQDVYDQFRSDMKDSVVPYFWTDTDVFRYMNAAYRMFVRLTGGIADFTSDITQVPIVTGEAIGETDKRILRVMNAYRTSDMSKIDVINEPDLTFARDNDYGMIRPIYLDTTPGPVRYMIIGSERGKCKWVQVPEVDDTAQLYVYRLPRDAITIDTDPSFEFDEIGDEHVDYLALWMRHLGYLKADAETFNGDLSKKFKGDFEEYCRLAKAEVERAKAKVRTVVYGGL